jgi:hypothetical protein
VLAIVGKKFKNISRQFRKSAFLGVSLRLAWQNVERRSRAIERISSRALMVSQIALSREKRRRIRRGRRLSYLMHQRPV